MFVAQYDYQARDPKDLSFIEGKAVNMVLQWLQVTGEILQVIDNEEGDWWLMHSFNTENKGYVPSNYLVPMEKNLSSM